MPKLLQNRISRTIEAEKLQAIETAIQTILQHLGEATPITNAELTPLSKLGASSKVGADQVFGLLQSAPSFLEPQQSVVEIEKDKVIFEQLGTIRNWLSPVLAWLDREQQLAGAEYKNGLSVFEGNIKSKARVGNREAALVLDQLNLIARTTGRSKKTTPAPE